MSYAFQKKGGRTPSKAELREMLKDAVEETANLQVDDSKEDE